MAFVTQTIPPRSQVGYLDPEIANEGQKVIHSDGEIVDWQPPPVKPVIPDLSQVKTLQLYFGRLNYPIFPAWLYHPTIEKRIVKNAEEAAQLGVHYRKATDEEHMRYGREYLWDYWTENSEWRPAPIGTAKFDPVHPGPGKTFVASQPNPSIAQNAMIADLVPAVAAAVAQSLKMSGASAPANIDPARWNEFLKFEAWKEANKAVEIISDAVESDEPALNANALTVDDERVVWEQEARRKGIKVDGRWSLESLKAAIERAD